MNANVATGDARQRACADFRARFGMEPALLLRAPGRVNVLGEPAGEPDATRVYLALEQSIWLALRPVADGRVVLHDVDRAEALEFLALAPESSASSWRELVKGVAAACRAADWPLTGWEGCMASDLPVSVDAGASGALALLVARAFSECARLEWDAAQASRLCQQARLAWGGGEFTLYDGYAQAVAEERHAVWVDPRGMRSLPVRVPARFTWLLIMDDIPRPRLEAVLLDREAQCRAAARRMRLLALRDMTLTQFTQQAPQLEESLRRRVRHVVTESERVQRAISAMEKGDGEGLGIVLNSSHASLRDDFGLNDTGLDQLAQVVRGLPGCAGARPTGGLVLTLVAHWALSDFLHQLPAAVHASMGIIPVVRATQPAAGAGLG